MLKLIKLEIKKYKAVSLLRGILTTTFISAAVLFLIAFGDVKQAKAVFESYSFMAVTIKTINGLSYVIFGSVLISRMVVGEFKDKTILNLFLYPISRKKLIASKLTMISAIVFTASFLTDLFISAVIIIFSARFNIIGGNFTAAALRDMLVTFLTGSLSTAFISLIPVYFGMLRRSTSFTIVSAVILGSLLNSNSSGISLSSLAVVQIVFALLGIFSAWFTFRNIDKKDIVTA